MSKTIIGLTEEVTLHGASKHKIRARIDTGATRSSMDSTLAKKLHLGPILRQKKVRSAHGSHVRPIIECKITIAKKTFSTEFTLADRSHMKYKVLIGQNALKKDFLIDPMIE
ncbi:hypothetical protein GOV09_01815 [Candidatus Woesearchaeota archaeon]|nr:hypothetical protein [Candidatus Woesearchaeota archaeon]